MVNRPKKKGTMAETAVVKYARFHGFPAATRKVQKGSKDEGDIDLCPHVIVEVKADKSLDYPQFLREVHAEKGNAGAAVGVVAIKPPGVAEGRMGLWWMLMDAGTYDALEFLAGSNNFMASWLTQSEMATYDGKRPLKFKPGELLAQRVEHLRMMPGTKLRSGAARVSRTGWDMRFLYLPDGLELIRWAGFGEPMPGQVPPLPRLSARKSAATQTFTDEPVNWGTK